MVIAFQMKQRLKFSLSLLSAVFLCLGLLRAAPVVNLGPDQVVCNSTVLNAGNPGASYLWSTGASTQTISATLSGVYWVQVTDGSGTTRDSVRLWVFQTPATPVAIDTAICGARTLRVRATGQANAFAWFDAPNGGNFLGSGPSLTLPVTANTNVYVEAINGFTPYRAGRAAPGGTAFSNYYGIFGDRGVSFNAAQDLFLGELTVYANSVISSRIVLLNASGSPLDSIAVSLAPGANLVQPNFFVPAGSGYGLVIRDPVGGQLYVDAPVFFPLQYGGLTLTVPIPSSQNTNYNFFYNIGVNSNQYCASARDALSITVDAQPSVNLGKDTVLCGGASLTLDVSFPGAQYTWSNTATTAVQTFSAAGKYYVDVRINNCLASDSIEIRTYSSPTSPSATDTALCGAGNITLNAAGSADHIVWFDAPAGGSLLGSSSSITLNLSAGTTVYAQAINGVLPERIGPPTFGFTSSGNFYQGINNARGLRFNALNPFSLNQVTVFTDGPTTGRVLLRSASGTGLDSTDVQLQTGANVLNLDYAVPRGSGFELLFKNRNGGNLYIDLPYFNYPFSNNELEIVAGTPIPDHYNYFYDWKINLKNNCASPRTAVNISVLDQPDINLGRDSVICDNSPVTLNGFFPGARYSWSTGDTTANIQVLQAGTYRLTASIGPCATTDEVAYVAYNRPAPPSVRDTLLCGSSQLALLANSGGAQLIWYDTALGGALIGKNSPFQVFVQDDKTYYAQTVNGMTPLIAGLSNNISRSVNGNYFAINDERGMVFSSLSSFVLNAVTIYVNAPTQATIVLYDRNGLVINSKRINLAQAGANEVVLDFHVPRGNLHRLTLKDRVGGGLFVDYPVNFTGLQYDFLLLVQGFPAQNTDNYNYFYQWKINQNQHCGSSRVPLRADVKFPNELIPYRYVCDSVVLNAGSAPGQYQWSTGATGSSITVKSSGLYIVSISDGVSCLVTDSTRVEIPQRAGLPADGILCGNVIRSRYTAPATFLWSTGAATPTLFVNQPGLYKVTISEPGGCTLQDSIQVTGFSPFPVVNLGNDQFVCEGAMLNAGNPGMRFQWSTGDTTQNITVNSTGVYIARVTNINGCTSSDTISINVIRRPRAGFFYRIDNGNNLKVNFSNTSSFGSYAWDFGDGGSSTSVAPSHTYLGPGMYRVCMIVTNQCGKDTLCINVNVIGVGLEESLTSTALDLYPNPAFERLFLRSAQQLQSVSLRLSDLAGRTIAEEHIAQLPAAFVHELKVEHLPAGLYLLQVRTASSVRSYPVQVLKR